MGAIIEVKYYNSFWAKKIKTITDVANSEPTFSSQSGASITVSSALGVDEMNVGQKVVIEYDTDEVYTGSIIERTSDTVFVVSPTPDTLSSVTSVKLGPINDFTNIPKAYAATAANDWFIEESRIRGGYNNTTVDFGVKAYAVGENTKGETRTNAMIYSGVYNSRTGINNTNEFSVAEDITKAIDPAYGSIQKLYAEDSNLIIFQEDKVSRALIDKDAIYSAEGGGAVTSSNLVIGQIVPYAGEFGISTEPESFAVYGYRKYFTDRKRNAVLRLSRDGIEEISRYGMTDWWRDELNELNLNNNATIVGGYDNYNKKYEVSIRPIGQYTGLEDPSDETAYTLSFSEESKGWASFYEYYPDFIGSLGNNFYSFKDGKIWKHYSNNSSANFYGDAQNAYVDFVFNPSPSSVKTFKTINYEGTNNWQANITTNENASYSVSNDESDSGITISKYSFSNSLLAMESNWLASNKFIKKENKYFVNIINNSTQKPGEVIFGKSISGVKGFWANVRFLATPQTAETKLFAVSTEYVESSY